MAAAVGDPPAAPLPAAVPAPADRIGLPARRSPARGEYLFGKKPLLHELGGPVRLLW